MDEQTKLYRKRLWVDVCIVLIILCTWAVVILAVWEVETEAKKEFNSVCLPALQNQGQVDLLQKQLNELGMQQDRLDENLTRLLLRFRVDPVKPVE